MRALYVTIVFAFVSISATASAFSELGSAGYRATQNGCFGITPLESDEAKAMFMHQAIEEAEEQRKAPLPLFLPPAPWGEHSTLVTRSESPFRVGSWSALGHSPFRLARLDGAGAFQFLATHRRVLGAPSLAYVKLAEARSLEPYEHSYFFRFTQSIPGVDCDCQVHIFVDPRSREVTRVESSLMDLTPAFRARPTLPASAALAALRAMRPELDLRAVQPEEGVLEIASDEHGDAHLVWSFGQSTRGIARQPEGYRVGVLPTRVAVDAHNGVFRGFVSHHGITRPPNDVPRMPKPSTQPRTIGSDSRDF